MGITIYYRGKINQTDLVDRLTAEMEDFAHSLEWRTQHWKEDWSKSHSGMLSQDRKSFRPSRHGALRGITLFPHKNCELLSLTFDPNGSLVDARVIAMQAQTAMKRDDGWVSIKTQFAPLESHITIVKLLQYLKKRYVADLEIIDEGGYWESGNVDELKRRFDSINSSLDILESALSASRPRNLEAMSPEELVLMIERIIKEKFGDDQG